MHSLPELAEDTPVWITTDKQKSQGTVIRSLGCPRSLIVSTSTGELRKNRRHLNTIPQPQEQAEQRARVTVADTETRQKSYHDSFKNWDAHYPTRTTLLREGRCDMDLLCSIFMFSNTLLLYNK